MEGIAALLGSENGLRYRGVSQLQSHQSRLSEQLREGFLDGASLEDRSDWTTGVPDSGVRKRVVSKRVVLADVPPERKPERGYVRQNHPFGNRPFISQ